MSGRHKEKIRGEDGAERLHLVSRQVGFLDVPLKDLRKGFGRPGAGVLGYERHAGPKP